MLNWHRLFGLFLIDYFTDSPYVVELEKDLSIKQQFLDVVVLRKGPGRFQGQLPDGLDNLAAHNLLTYRREKGARPLYTGPFLKATYKTPLLTKQWCS